MLLLPALMMSQRYMGELLLSQFELLRVYYSSSRNYCRTSICLDRPHHRAMLVNCDDDVVVAGCDDGDVDCGGGCAVNAFLL
jgi:hypothetical protein